MLTVYIDFKSPAAYLALKPTLDLASRLSLPLDWRAFQTVERDVPKLGKEETVGESHRRVRAASQRSLAIKYAGHQGIDLKFPPHPGVTDLALGVLADLEGDPLPFIQAAFAAYWQDHADLDDADTVRAIIDRSGVEYGAGFDTARHSLDLAMEQAEDAGIVGAPAYVIDEQIFVGREHLPWIEEIARAKAGRSA